MKRIFAKFQTKVTLGLVLSMLFIGLLSNYLIYKYTLESQFEQLRERLKMVARTAALLVDADTLMQVPLNREGMKSLQYQVICEKLKKVQEANPTIRYIYTMAQTNQKDIYQFIADPNPLIAVGKKNVSSYPGDKYDASRFPEMLLAFSGSTADKKLTVDEWGVFLSGYAPIRDKNGKSVAILGIDMSAHDVYKLQQQISQRAVFVLILGFLVAIILGMIISKRISGPVKKLVEGTRHIAEGNLQYQVDVKGADEISELAQSFNNMGSSLFESRKELHNYFYRVVQSLVRILEAKDHYTRGHSERVSEYAGKIAQEMGMPAEKVEMLKEAGILHDIGKLGIHEDILNKKGKLTDEEFEIICQHPIVGAEILSPVLLTEEMLAAVKGHHERYDGTGYPDKLRGDKINIYAQILAVADTYDAMTSSRSYRSMMEKEKAIEELTKNKGTQFNPQIVDVFVKILQEEK
jgi:putative nucleotidyltransferase with HDIG domain